MYYANELIEKIKNACQVVVFGAGDIADLIIRCLQEKPYNLIIEYCMVSDLRGNPSQIAGIPVIDYISAEYLVRKDAVILVTVIEKYLNSIENGLSLHGYRNVIPLTFESDLWSLLRGDCYRLERLACHHPYLTIEEELQRVKSEVNDKKIKIYSIRCHMDKELKEDISRFSWEIPIQAGAALTKQRICSICDNTGDQISDKNEQYCELTALYWIWKNDKSDYIGLSHYRRHFELTEEQLKQLSCSDIDVVLTIPIMDVPDVETIYRRDHIGADWDVMLEAVENLCPGYLESVEKMQRGRFYYAYNMFIMRREILDQYCTWLFPILYYCEEHCGKKEDIYQNRYIGFLAEHLMSAYFLHHEEQYKIVHARKHFVM